MISIRTTASLLIALSVSTLAQAQYSDRRFTEQSEQVVRKCQDAANISHENQIRVCKEEIKYLEMAYGLATKYNAIDALYQTTLSSLYFYIAKAHYGKAGGVSQEFCRNLSSSSYHAKEYERISGNYGEDKYAKILQNCRS